ncbi:hypothetical protein XELAEV_18029306mg [Xenopus laevis]|uniref:Uncharacterized protein n=1 Tax=Xenopus laevis TaxID=8355 RepID=A0A974HHH5_XENLA|nr:hypothetical protein XELAEV_18029306mg [Xenopus laevis]
MASLMYIALFMTTTAPPLSAFFIMIESLFCNNSRASCSLRVRLLVHLVVLSQMFLTVVVTTFSNSTNASFCIVGTKVLFFFNPRCVPKTHCQLQRPIHTHRLKSLSSFI